jgi:hypothetical protein
MSVKQDENEPEQKRLRILTKDEIKSIYERPNFTLEEQSSFFTLSQPEKDLLTLFRNINSQAYFILQLGYFKAKYLFFTFDFCDVKEDLFYILKQHFPEYKVEGLTLVNKRTRLKQQKLILELFNYRACGSIEKNQIETKAHKAVAVCCKPVYIFREVMHYLYSQRIMIPGYSFMQEDIVGKAIVYEQNRLATIVKNNLEETYINDLKLLLDDSDGLYMITQIKHEPKDFSRGEIKLEIGYLCPTPPKVLISFLTH